MDGYVVENVTFKCMLGLFITGNLYRAANVGGKMAGILTLHGHWSDEKDYGYNKCRTAYPFLVKYLKLDILRASILNTHLISH